MVRRVSTTTYLRVKVVPQSLDRTDRDSSIRDDYLYLYNSHPKGKRDRHGFFPFCETKFDDRNF